MEAWWQRFFRLVRRGFARPPDFPPPADSALLNQIKGWFAEHLVRHPEIPMEQRGEYARAAGVIFERMTPTALLRLVRQVRAIAFYVSLEAMTVQLAKSHPRVAREMAAGTPIGGAYIGERRELHLDGGDEDEGMRPVLGRYAHEFGHAIDGPNHAISGSRSWQAAWRAELRAGKLSPLAAAAPHEGFAEVARFLYTEPRHRRALTRKFPLCAEVWEEQGLC